MTLMGILLGAAAMLLLVPIGILLVEVLLAVTYPAESQVIEGDRGRVAVLMPAHDEVSLIADSLRSIVPQLNPGDRLLVVADNCSDDTAAVAISEGAEAVIRHDARRRGKGYALDFGIRHLALDPPDVVIVADADCHLSSSAIDDLARVCDRTMRPVQALYLMRSRGGGLRMRLAEFAWVVRNRVRPIGMHHLRLPCQLMGTGMAFPWPCISTISLASGHIVEDLKMGLDLALAGTPALFCPSVVATSDFPESSDGARSQRTRWEHGHLSVIVADAPRLFMRAIAARNRDLLALVLDLSVPPLALLALFAATVWFASALWWAFGNSMVPFAVASAGATLLATAVLLSWRYFGREIISLGDLAVVPVYLVSKIPMYVRFVLARQIEWVRSKRGT